LTVANNDPKCQNYSKKVDLNRQYCLYDKSKDIDQSNVCFGDSGGPFFYKKNEKWYIYGITSWGDDGDTGRCVVKNPSFFTSVPVYIDWIVDKIYPTASATSFNNLQYSIYLYFLIFIEIIINFK
jgi:secreted trypsin-like serine protease